MYFYSRQTKGFYIKGFHTEIPTDAVSISEKNYLELMQAQAGGLSIDVDEDGLPLLSPVSLGLDVIKLQLVVRVNTIYQNRMAAIADGYPLHERESWPVQLEEAHALQADPEAATPWLDACAAARGLDKTELARRVLEKDAAYRVISGNLSGIRQRHEDAIALLETVEQAQAYDVHAWWPE